MTDEAALPPMDYSLLGDEHVRVYRESGGEVGYIWNGAPIILVTTKGRKSDLERTAALIYGRDGDSYVIVASVGGMPKHPAWYGNLTADPHVRIQDRTEVIDAIARTADASEKPRLWSLMTEIWPRYDVYQARTERDIPVVVLDPVAGSRRPA